jgi:hypothetical protein
MKTLQHENMQPVLNSDDGKMPMDLQEKQCPIVDFSLLESYRGDELTIYLENINNQVTYCSSLVF